MTFDNLCERGSEREGERERERERSKEREGNLRLIEPAIDSEIRTIEVGTWSLKVPKFESQNPEVTHARWKPQADAQPQAEPGCRPECTATQACTGSLSLPVSASSAQAATAVAVSP